MGGAGPQVGVAWGTREENVSAVTGGGGGGGGRGGGGADGTRVWVAVAVSLLSQLSNTAACNNSRKKLYRAFTN